MVLHYTVCDIEFLNPVKFPYPGSPQVFLHDLILGLPYTVQFPYPIKASVFTSDYFSKINNN